MCRMGRIAVAPEKNHPFTLCQALSQAPGVVKITDDECSSRCHVCTHTGHQLGRTPRHVRK